MSQHRKIAPVRKAVIPVAGLGTRFLPVTRSVPKALLPVISKPLIHYAVEEAAAAGIEQVVLVLGPGMEAVGGYFSPQPALEAALKGRGHNGLLAEQLRISAMTRVVTVVQEQAHGLGHAVLMAREFVGDEPFAVLLPDDLLWSTPPAIAQLMAVRDLRGGSVVAVREVPRDRVSSFGVIDGAPAGDGVFAVRRLVEKPKPEQAPSNLAIVGRYVLEPRVFEHLRNGKPGAGGEVQLTDAISATIGETPVHACTLKGYHADAGVPAGMLQAALYEAGKDPALRQLVLSAVEAWGRERAAS